MKTKLTQSKYKHKKGCGCKLCKPQKGNWADLRTVRDKRLAIDHQQQLDELK